MGQDNRAFLEMITFTERLIGGWSRWYDPENKAGFYEFVDPWNNETQLVFVETDEKNRSWHRPAVMIEVIEHMVEEVCGQEKQA